MLHVLEHVYNPSAALNKCAKLLKSDGILVIAVPNNTFSPQRFIRSLLKIYYKKICIFPVLTSKSESHVNHFTDKSLNAVMKYHDFNLVKMDIDTIYTKTNDTTYTWRDIYFRFCQLLKYMTGRDLYFALFNIYKKEV